MSFLAVARCDCAVSAGDIRPRRGQGPAEDVRWFQLVLRDGSRLVGTIVNEDDEQVVLRNESGTIVAARRDDIASLKEITGDVVDGRFVPRDPNATRLFFGPTGRSLARGQTYLGVYEFLMPFVQVGITDRLRSEEARPWSSGSTSPTGHSG